uniref:Ribonuclease A-domain domain-containing protein n=1 Tax=Pelusios castaneus TaxID=367368 RepID=A0A8C8RWX6_9SAUR
MAQRGHHYLLFLPLILLAADLAQLSEGVGSPQFLNQHIDYPRSGSIIERGYCDRMMQRRGLTRPVCKATNIFIHAPASQVRTVCDRGGKHVHGNIYDSIAHFQLTVCQLVSSIGGRCSYRGTVKNSRIRVWGLESGVSPF